MNKIDTLIAALLIWIGMLAALVTGCYALARWLDRRRERRDLLRWARQQQVKAGR